MSELIDHFVKQGYAEEEAEMMLYDAAQAQEETKALIDERMIIVEMTQSVWQEEQKRLAKLKAKLLAEDRKQYWLAKENLKVYKAAFEAAEGDAKVIAGRRYTRAIVCEQDIRERKTGVTPDMKCDCGFVKGRGYSCKVCDLWRKAYYGGNSWIETGVCNSSYY